MAESLKQIALRLPPELLERIDKAAKEAGQDRSNFIRACVHQVISGGGLNRYPEIDQLEVVDERSRDVIRSVLARLDRLERAQFGDVTTPDPFT
ncbi:hypothetical protein KR100_01955 [Synechococcus sp. KORDI-100]|uniref:ribbon-helix-helix domain-containing protein n=1 Tax=Synechococcus sp. KORDI-100 TaxID=1280380 RepID=UPI0004E0663D|nr:ribbon-helix-helix domain-containing protein [Synechococcus sp. KORDI-100]AII42169.1 hypothetical protein KR100_01955 [Synechococcus sp. KORDI-100]